MDTTLDPAFWLNRRVLITGHSGFKGIYLTSWLHQLGADIVGFSLEPTHSRPLYQAANINDLAYNIKGDIRNDEMLNTIIAQHEPEIIFHLAANAIVLSGLKTPVQTFDTNVMGTVKLLEAARRSPGLRAVVVVSSDKCYAPAHQPLSEDARLGGRDPYSCSKSCVELAADCYRQCYLQSEDGIGLTTARAGNVIGGGDFSQNRLLPDLIRGWMNGQEVLIRHPDSVRPWQHILDAIYGYIKLAQHACLKPELHSKAYNFGSMGDKDWRVSHVVEHVTGMLNSSWRVHPCVESVENPVLKLDARLAKKTLGWKPVLSVSEALTWTVDGYQQLLESQRADWLFDQIELYDNMLKRNRMAMVRPSGVAVYE